MGIQTRTNATTATNATTYSKHDKGEETERKRVETCHGNATTASSKATTASQGMFTIDITGIGKTLFLPVNTSSGRRKRNEQNDLKKNQKKQKYNTLMT